MFKKTYYCKRHFAICLLQNTALFKTTLSASLPLSEVVLDVRFHIFMCCGNNIVNAAARRHLVGRLACKTVWPVLVYLIH